MLLDLDTVTNPLLDALGPDLAPTVTGTTRHDATDVRPARYATLLAVAADQVVDEIVLVAPFTAELRGGPEWSALLAAVAPADAPRGVAGRRRRRSTRSAGPRRGEPRDRFPVVPQEVPAIPHQRVDAAAPTSDQLAALLD